MSFDLNIKTLSLDELPAFERQIRDTATCAFKCPGYDDDMIADLKAKTDPVIKIYTDQKDNVVSFGYGYIAEAGALVSFLKLEPYDIPHLLLAADKTGQIGIIKTIITDPYYQGMGVGTEMVQDIEFDLLKKDARIILVPAWKSGDRINIHGTMENTGYKKELSVAEFWKKDCDSGAFQCTDRIDKCICSAVFYKKEFGISENEKCKH